MEEVEKVISLYGIRPITISKITDRVHKIDDGQQQYALKKSRLSDQRIPAWERTFRDAHQQQLTCILPLFLTTRNALQTVFDQHYYYLTPWINGQQSTIEQLYRSIGKIHKQTQKSQSIDHEQMAHQFNQYKIYCDEAQRELLSHVKRFESHIYMSPFELQVCTHYRDIELVFKKIHKQITRFIDEQDKSLLWNYSLCHGNLKLSHSLETDRTYILNWEQASVQHPTTDLVVLFKNELINYDAPAENWLDSFTVYMEENKLNHHELLLLIIHLLDPTNYMTIIQQYIDQPSNQTMIDQIKKLQITYRQSLFALQFLDFIDQDYLSITSENFEA